MSDGQLIPATIGGFDVIEFGFADANAPVLILRSEPVVAWQHTASGTLRPLTASPEAFDLDDKNVVLVHPSGAAVCRGQRFPRLAEYIESRREALKGGARERASRGAGTALGQAGTVPESVPADPATLGQDTYPYTGTCPSGVSHTGAPNLTGEPENRRTTP